MQIDAVKIPGLMKFKKMVHGTSPRFCITEDKKKEELNLNPKSDSRHRNNLRKKFLLSLGTLEREPIFLNQVHGDQIFCIDEMDLSLTGEVLMGDALISNVPNINIAVFTADCLPVIMYDPHLNIVGVIHAGRKGTSLKIVSKTLQRMIQKYGSVPKNIMLGFGPGIGGCCYEVGDECLESFRDSYLQVERFTFPKKKGKSMLDLKLANRLDALGAGILDKNIFDCQICTVCSNNLFFSYRKMDAGRMMTVAMLLP